MSGGGAGEADFENKPPVIAGNAAATVTLPDTLMLNATATDDGRPIPPDNKRPFGMRMRWIVWRGNAKNVKFDPDIMADRVYGKPAMLPTKVTFTAPGEYRCRGSNRWTAHLDLRCQCDSQKRRPLSR